MDWSHPEYFINTTYVYLLKKDASAKMKLKLAEKMQEKEARIHKLEEEIKGFKQKMDEKVRQVFG